jgi:hypothetical protein
MDLPPVQNTTVYFQRLTAASGDICAPSFHTAKLVKTEPNYAIAIKKNQRVVAGPNVSVLTRWKESFSQLKSTLIPENYNTEVGLPTLQVVNTVIGVLRTAYSVAPHLKAPDVVPDLDGNLDVEWALSDRFISVHIDRAGQHSNRIFVKDAKGYRSEPFNKDNLQLILNT